MSSKRIVPFLVLGLIYVMYGGLQSSGGENTNNAQLRVHQLADSLESGSISRVEVLHIPTDILTRARISPQMLEKQFYCKVVFEAVRGPASFGKLSDLMKGASVRPETEAADLRWGILFYSGEGKRIGAIYLNGQGTRGYVDETSVSFAGGLKNWLDGTFSGWK